MTKKTEPNIQEETILDESESQVVEEVTEVKTELQACEAEVENFKNLYLRALADYKNLENRMNQLRSQMQVDIKKRCIDAFLEVSDHMDQAEVFIKDSGLVMVAKSFKQALEKQGVYEIDVLGKEYDPHTAEVIEVIPGDKDDVVVEVLQKGYITENTVIRPARVKVSKKQ